MFDVKHYQPEINEELTSIGAAFICILDISEEDDSQDRLCKRCHPTVFAVQMAEDKLRQRKRKSELKVKFLVVQFFFSSLKRVRGLSTPIEILTSNQSPAVKHSTEGNPGKNSFSPSTMFVVKFWSEPHNLNPTPHLTMIVV